MKTFKFRVFCEITQQGVDLRDAENRLRSNINDSHDYIADDGVSILREREGCPSPVYPATVARMVVLDGEEER